MGLGKRGQQLTRRWRLPGLPTCLGAGHRIGGSRAAVGAGWRAPGIGLWAALMAGAAVGVGAAGAAGADLAAARAALAETERAFSRLSLEQGMRAAFLAYLGDDAVIFRPGPVPGRAFIAARPSPPIELSWRPVYVEVAAAGDLGYTTGPYELRSTDPAKRAETEHGYYVTVWRKQADGAWKVAADLGVDTPPPAGTEAAKGNEIGHGRIAGGAPSERGPAEAARRGLLDAENAFAGDAVAHGARPAYLAAAADEARFYRDGAPPAVGREAIAKLLLAGGPQRATSWRATAAAAASGGDLGYTYGEMAVMDTGAPRRIRVPGMFFRIWERQGNGRWKIVLDLVKELPPSAPPAAPAAPTSPPPPSPPASPPPPEAAPAPPPAAGLPLMPPVASPPAFPALPAPSASPSPSQAAPSPPTVAEMPPAPRQVPAESAQPAQPGERQRASSSPSPPSPPGQPRRAR
jgi:ketosteroid isomerase-like protein